MVRALAAEFDQVRVIPCGPRPDKAVTGSIPPVYRAALADLAFGGLDRVIVDLSDLEQDSFTRSWLLQERYAALGELWHVVGSDLIAGGGRGQSPIQTSWERGAWLWENACFAVLSRPGHRVDPQDLPPRARLIPLGVPGSSTEIRARLGRGEPVDELIAPRVRAYIERYGLYRAPVPGTWARMSLRDEPFC